MDSLDGDADRTRTRRGLIWAAGGAGAFLLAGCTEDVGEEFPENREWRVAEYLPALPVRERSVLLAEEIERLADADVREPEDLADAFEDDAFEVGAIERDRDVLSVAYARTDRTWTGDLHAVGPLAGAYAALIDAGYEAASMSLSILDDAPSSYGIATIQTTWAEAFNAGEISAETYGEHVTGTIESKRHSPEVGVSPGE
jgi:hypothetical protein